MTAAKPERPRLDPIPLWYPGDLRHVVFWVNVYNKKPKGRYLRGAQCASRADAIAAGKRAEVKPLYRIKVTPKAQAQTPETFMIGLFGD